ncbi:hypothetical protein HGRIS_013303 [Hohenbuehelia grisea]|uniref:Uncharacterized protein n=1 Tax=Hohenbuehelia grisea TaxID=104357 RepID=A0ABR3IV10_9AGAR
MEDERQRLEDLIGTLKNERLRATEAHQKAMANKRRVLAIGPKKAGGGQGAIKEATKLKEAASAKLKEINVQLKEAEQAFHKMDGKAPQRKKTQAPARKMPQPPARRSLRSNIGNPTTKPSDEVRGASRGRSLCIVDKTQNANQSAFVASEQNTSAPLATIEPLKQQPTSVSRPADGQDPHVNEEEANDSPLSDLDPDDPTEAEQSTTGTKPVEDEADDAKENPTGDDVGQATSVNPLEDEGHKGDSSEQGDGVNGQINESATQSHPATVGNDGSNGDQQDPAAKLHPLLTPAAMALPLPFAVDFMSWTGSDGVLDASLIDGSASLIPFSQTANPFRSFTQSQTLTDYLVSDQIDLNFASLGTLPIPIESADQGAASSLMDVTMNPPFDFPMLNHADDQPKRENTVHLQLQRNDKADPNMNDKNGGEEAQGQSLKRKAPKLVPKNLDEDVDATGETDQELVVAPAKVKRRRKKNTAPKGCSIPGDLVPDGIELCSPVGSGESEDEAGKRASAVIWDNLGDEEKETYRAKCQDAIKAFNRNGTDIPDALRTLMRDVWDLTPEVATTSRKLASHVLTTAWGNLACPFHHVHRTDKKFDGPNPGQKNVIEGIGYKRNFGTQKTRVTPPKGFWHCGCREDLALISFFFHKTWIANPTRPNFIWEESMNLHDMKPRTRLYVVQNTLKLHLLTLDDLYTNGVEKFDNRSYSDSKNPFNGQCSVFSIPSWLQFAFKIKFIEHV